MAAKSSTTWNVLEHGPVEHLAENLWRVQGALPGMSLERVMTVARRPDQGLVVHNAIALEDRAMRELEGLGELDMLLVPSAMHRLDAPAYKARYPHLRVYTPRGSRAKVEQRVKVDGTYDDFPSDDVVRLETLEGTGGLEGAMIVRSKDGVTVVLNDVVFNMDKKRDLLGWLVTSIFGSAPGPRVSRLAKMLLVKDQAKLREELERYAKLPDLTRLIVAHEKMASGKDAARVLLEASKFLKAAKAA